MSWTQKLAAVCVAVISFGASFAQARQFNFKSESIATYFRGTYGTSSLGTSAYGFSGDSGVSVDKSVSAAASGEFGLLFSGNRFNLRLGGEYVIPRGFKDIKGTDAIGTHLFDLSSSVTALVAMANIESLAYQTATSRMLVGFGGGVAFVSSNNVYKVTADGTNAFPGVTDHEEAAVARVTALQAYVGYETLFTDTVTVAFDLGYRHIPIATLRSTKDVTSFSGTQTNGSEITNTNGTHRSLDLSGPFVGMSLRFYIGL